MKMFLEYLWYGIVLGIVLTYVETIIYDLGFSWFRVINYMILCSITIWLINKFKIEVNSLRRGV